MSGYCVCVKAGFCQIRSHIVMGILKLMYLMLLMLTQQLLELLIDTP